MMTMLAILQHALGRDQFGKPRHGGEDYRNHVCVGEGPDLVMCREAVSQGLMRDRGQIEWCAGETVVTDKGKAYIAKHSPSAPKLTRGQERYRKWLDVRDVYNISFGDWLKRKGQSTCDDLRGAEDSFAASWSKASAR